MGQADVPQLAERLVEGGGADHDGHAEQGGAEGFEQEAADGAGRAEAALGQEEAELEERGQGGDVAREHEPGEAEVPPEQEKQDAEDEGRADREVEERAGGEEGGVHLR